MFAVEIMHVDLFKELKEFSETNERDCTTRPEI
jgi:hypothetical protein